MTDSSFKEIIVPIMGESVTEVVVQRWLKEKGDYVKTDEPIVELETDKITLEVFSPSDGVLVDIFFEKGFRARIGAVLGHVKSQKQGRHTQELDTQKKKIENKGEQSKDRNREAVSSAQKGLLSVPEKENEEDTDSAIHLAPSVRRLIAEHNLRPEDIPGSGKDGRLTKADILSYLTQWQQKAEQKEKESSELEQRIKMTPLRQKIAERLKESQNTAAILTTFNEVDLTEVSLFRQLYREEFEKKYSIKLGYMSFFVKATIKALKEFPIVNASIEGDEIVYKNYFDIGIAISAPQGLVVPVVRDADLLTFSEIESSIVNLSQKAKENKLTLQELAGGTFTISNGGVFGSLLSTPIVNPPQSAILGMHKIQDRPVVIKGEIKIRPMMYLALSYDHRLIDGRDAVSFLIKIKEALETPERILLEL